MRTERPVRSRDSSRPASVLGFAIPILAFLRMAIREVTRDDLRKKTPLEWYNAELAKKPHDVGLWYAKGALLTKQGDHLEAIACFEKVTELDPDHNKGWDAEAGAYFRIGDYEKSVYALDRLLEIEEENETLWYRKGEALLKLGRYAEANSCYDKAIDLNPNYTDAWCGKGNALKGIGKEEKESTPPDKAKPASEDRTFKDALDCFKKVLQLNPKHHEARGSRGSLLCEMERYEEGLRDIDIATEADPNLYEPLLQKARVLQTQGQKRQAARVFESILKSSSSDGRPESIEGMYWKGIAATELGNTQIALDSYNRILALNPRHVSTWVAKGNTLTSMENHSQASECYDKALSLEPNQDDVWLMKGNSERDLGRLEDSLVSYDKAIAIAPMKIDARYSRGLVLYAVERMREAMGDFLHVLDLDSSHLGATKMKGAVESRLFERVEPALELSRSELKEKQGYSHPSSMEVLRSREPSKEELVFNGIRFFSQQKYKDAFECFSQAIELDDGDYTLWEWKGDTLVKLTRYSDAIECYDRAIKLKHRKGKGKEVPLPKVRGNVAGRGRARGRGKGLPILIPGGGGAGVGAATHKIGPQKQLDTDADTKFSIDKSDKSILDRLLDRPMTIGEISRLCETNMAILYPRIEFLCSLGFIRRHRAIFTLDRGTRRICLYQTEKESYRALTA